MKKILKIGYNLIIAVLVLFLLAVAGTLFPFEKFFGGKVAPYRIFTVQSGSMEPKIGMGGLIFVRQAVEYNVGDVITFKAGKNTVTHRVVGKSGEGAEVIYETKGDANEEADGETVAASNIVGKTFFTLPYVGYPIGYARTKVGFILLIIIPSTIIVYEELYKIKEEIAKKVARRKPKTSGSDDVESRIRIVEDEPDRTLPEFMKGEEPRRSPRRRVV